MYKLYTKQNCSYCDKAKALLNLKKLEYKSFLLDEDFTREELLEMFPNAKTFPVILDENDVYIGGYTQLEGKLNNE